jgi:hypothetical protein
VAQHNEANSGDFNGRVDRYFKYAQILAIAVGGAWVGFEYLSFKRVSDRLGNKLSAVSFQEKQMDIQLKDLQVKHAERDQEIEYLRRQTELRLAELGIADKQVQLRYLEQDKRLQQVQNELSIKEQQRQGELSELKLNLIKSHQIEYTDDLKVAISTEHPDGTVEGEASLYFGVKNKAAVQLEVSATVIQGFIGTIDLRSESADGTSILPMNLPPNIFSQRSLGPIHWRQVLSQTFIYGASLGVLLHKESFFQAQNPYDFQTGGGITGLYRQNEGSDLTYSYAFKCKKNMALGFVTNVIFNQGAGDGNHWYFPHSHRFWSVDRQTNTTKSPGSGGVSAETK